MTIFPEGVFGNLVRNMYYGTISNQEKPIKMPQEYVNLVSIESSLLEMIRTINLTYCTIFYLTFEQNVIDGVQNENQRCLDSCDGKEGRCGWCGPDGWCCMLGVIGNGCTGNMGLGSQDHVCTREGTLKFKVVWLEIHEFW